jgi:hypothetical protein
MYAWRRWRMACRLQDASSSLKGFHLVVAHGSVATGHLAPWGCGPVSWISESEPRCLYSLIADTLHPVLAVLAGMQRGGNCWRCGTGGGGFQWLWLRRALACNAELLACWRRPSLIPHPHQKKGGRQKVECSLPPKAESPSASGPRSCLLPSASCILYLPQLVCAVKHTRTMLSADEIVRLEQR